MTKAQRYTLISLVSVAVLILLVLGSAAGLAASYQNRVWPHTTVGGVSLGSQPLPQANQTIAQQAAILAQKPITLTLDGSSQQLTAETLGIRPNWADATSQISHSNSWTDWLTVSYWQRFFATKNIALANAPTSDQVAQVVAQKFQLSNAPQNASLAVANGSLNVVASNTGTAVNGKLLASQITATLSNANAVTLAVPLTSQTAPAITTADATAIQAQINQQLHTVALTGNGKTYTITPADQYSFLDFTTSNNQLQWQIDQTKLQNYLQTQIANKINTKSVTQIIQNQTNDVLTAGQNGQQVDIKTLEANVYQTITVQNPNTSPVTIPISTVAFSTINVDPGYDANLFPGLYVDVNLTEQRMYIMNSGDVTAQYLVSTGAKGTPTPNGQYYVCAKNPKARSDLYNDLWMPEWNALSTSPTSCDGYQGYGVHALPCFNYACTLVEGVGHLGTPISHGCIRLSDENAVWFYQNIPIGTPVHVHT